MSSIGPRPDIGDVFKGPSYTRENFQKDVLSLGFGEAKPLTDEEINKAITDIHARGHVAVEDTKSQNAAGAIFAKIKHSVDQWIADFKQAGMIKDKLIARMHVPSKRDIEKTTDRTKLETQKELLRIAEQTLLRLQEGVRRIHVGQEKTSDAERQQIKDTEKDYKGPARRFAQRKDEDATKYVVDSESKVLGSQAEKALNEKLKELQESIVIINKRLDEIKGPEEKRTLAGLVVIGAEKLAKKGGVEKLVSGKRAEAEVSESIHNRITEMKRQIDWVHATMKKDPSKDFRGDFLGLEKEFKFLNLDALPKHMRETLGEEIEALKAQIATVKGDQTVQKGKRGAEDLSDAMTLSLLFKKINIPKLTARDTEYSLKDPLKRAVAQAYEELDKATLYSKEQFKIELKTALLEKLETAAKEGSGDLSISKNKETASDRATKAKFVKLVDDAINSYEPPPKA